MSYPVPPAGEFPSEVASFPEETRVYNGVYEWIAEVTQLEVDVGARVLRDRAGKILVFGEGKTVDSFVCREDE